VARDHARIKLSIWLDEDFLDLPPDAQHLYFVLLTDPGLSYAGVADWRPGRLAQRSKGWTADMVVKAAVTLSGAGYIVVDAETEEVLIRSFVRNDEVVKQPRIAVSMANAYAACASRTLRWVIVHELIRLHETQPELLGWGKPQAEKLLSLPAINPSSLAPFGDRFGDRFAPSLGETRSRVWGLPTPDPDPDPDPLLQIHGKFDEFWAAYPKRVGKDAARKAFTKAIKRASIETILAGARRYASDPNLPEKQFIPDPATWLNAGRWGDEPCPPRTATDRPPTGSSRAADIVAAGARLTQARQPALPGPPRAEIGPS